METVTVSADALRQILVALTGPLHLIGEIQATRSLHALTRDNPIEILIEQYNAAARQGQGDSNG